MDTEKADLRVPAIDRDGEQETEPADPGYPRIEMQETEENINLARPIDTLGTDEVEGRVDEAANAASNREQDHDSITEPQLHQSPEAKVHPEPTANQKQPGGDDDDEWE